MSTPTRSTWTADSVRAADLEDTDTALIDGEWREVLDVWNDEDDPAAMFGEDHPTAQAIFRMAAGRSPDWTIVRYVREEESSIGELAYGLRIFRCRDLVDVQRELVTPETTLAGPVSVLEPLDVLGVLGVLRSAVDLYRTCGDPGDALSRTQTEQIEALGAHFDLTDAQ
ncbi:hypothetical protein HUT18_11640 [Streptomyces sp. NA04227]|uniref:hypothetical protein n=1 Tax=Streptomyces sp. NA04227 TaxID=2742136 RepID=UPI00159097E1|nr:hypothetical protein [Streptomyces sp. NA04227]QKW06951.1 hypothetical protein HUT18_11640 [Streptomyces sp. NA04227]